MALSSKVQGELLDRGYTRRSIARIALGASAVLPYFHEFAFAQDDGAPAGRRGGRGGFMRTYDPDAVRITSNENPMGPSKQGLEAIAKVSPLAWRYGPQGDNNDLQGLLESTEDVKPGYVVPYPGSGTPLANLVPAFTSPTRSWVMASPGYGSGASRGIGNKVVKVPLRKDHSHDVEAMIKADPNAGAYYICNPNNPTGTLTPRKDMEYILAHKPKDAVLVIDEAYIHFSGRDNMSTDLVKADKDVVVLRTFSKIYGMAGLRAGMAYGRPDLLEQLAKFGRTGNLSVATMACAAASLKVADPLIKERMAINKRNRDLAFEHMEKLGVAYIPSHSNFFMMAVKGMTGPQVGEAMGKKKILLAGNRWPEWPEHIRVTVGTYEEMGKFNAALSQVVKEGPVEKTQA
ncbi:MAG TPA: aminotransferase class I/II-fold pyridoxal phosphate-dependent enzyme [Bryobacteraceae bacterium]